MLTNGESIIHNNMTVSTFNEFNLQTNPSLAKINFCLTVYGHATSFYVEIYYKTRNTNSDLYRSDTNSNSIEKSDGKKSCDRNDLSHLHDKILYNNNQQQ